MKLEDLEDAAVRAVKATIETRNHEKVRMFAAALIGSTAVDRPPDLDAESAVDCLASLTTADLDYARRVLEFLDRQPAGFHSVTFLTSDGPFRLYRLQGAGLVQGLGSGTPGVTQTLGRIVELLRAGGVTFGPKGNC